MKAAFLDLAQVRREELDLVRRLLDGDASAFDRFTESYVPLLYRFASRRLDGDREATARVVEATVRRLMAGLAAFGGGSALTSWMCDLCRREIDEHHRRQRRTVRPLAAALGGTADGKRPADDPADLVHWALDRLPPEWARALEWRYVERLGVAEIARRLGAAESRVTDLLARASEAFLIECRRLADPPESSPWAAREPASAPAESARPPRTAAGRPLLAVTSARR